MSTLSSFWGPGAKARAKSGSGPASNWTNSIHSSGIPTNVASSCMFSSCCLFLPLAAHHCSVKASTKTTQQAKNSSVRDVSFSSQKYAQRKTCRIQSHITVMTQASMVPYLGLSTVALCDAYNPRLVIHITSKAWFLVLDPALKISHLPITHALRHTRPVKPIKPSHGINLHWPAQLEFYRNNRTQSRPENLSNTDGLKLDIKWQWHHYIISQFGSDNVTMILWLSLLQLFES